jgi:ABC-2 type transport system permease protein
MEATMASLLKHELVSRWRVILGWGIGLALFGAMYTVIYPEMAQEITGLADLSVYEAMGMYMATFEGFLASTAVLFIPVILGVYAVLAATKSLGGEEDEGTLELLITTRVKRFQLASMKALALSVTLVLILVIAAAGNAAVFATLEVETEVTPGRLFWTILSAVPIMLAFTMVGLFLGAFMPNRRGAAALATVVFIFSYFSEGLSGMVDSLGFLEPLSLFSYFDTSAEVFAGGVRGADVAVLLGVAAVFYALTLLAFQRRNVMVGAWAWQRGRRGSVAGGGT